MASLPDPEVQFAQRLASNERQVRSRAVKNLRKYVSVRSQTGGFAGDELLRLWKGLFYCLWMQDKPLLQEELSRQISSLIHSFHDADGQFLYLESFLQTFKREWTGIDRLRMDKFFQLIRFMFRQTFELLKRKNWETSVVGRFLELLTVQLLQGGSGAPIGLQFHVLDLYMTELAAVASAELTADQNLMLIEPFCKTAAKTKERTLFRAICSSIFSTIIDQAPFAIEDLIKEVRADEASDSGQASEEDDEDQAKEKTTGKPVGKKGRGKQINGNKSHDKSDEDDDEDDDEFLHLEDSDTEEPCDEDVGPVLQFDYAALADKLFALASRSSTPSQNRQRLYKIITVLRDLSDGVFPQDEYPEDVSTDEDDDMFGSRTRMKRAARHVEVEDEDGEPATKKSKGKKNEASTLKKNKDGEAAGCTANTENKKKKRKKKKKKDGQGGGGGCEEQIGGSIKDETQVESSVSSVTVTEASSSEGPSEAPPSVAEHTGQPCSADNKNQPETISKKKKKKKKNKTPEATEADGEHQSPAETEPETPAEAPASGKTKKRGLKGKIQTDVVVNGEAEEVTPVSSEESAEKTPERDSTTAAAKKKKKKGVKAKKSPEEVEVNEVSAEADTQSIPLEDSAKDVPTAGLELADPSVKKKKKSKKKNLKAGEARAEEEEASQDTNATPLKKKTKGKQDDTTAEDESSVTPLKTKKRKNNQKESKTTEEEGGVEISQTPTKKRKKNQKLEAAQEEEIEDQTELPLDEPELLSSSGKPAKKKKKKKIPVVFEFEADEVEAASTNGLAEEETKPGSDVGEPSTPLSTKKSQKKAKASSASGFVTFQSNATVPTPIFFKTKGSPSTPLSSKKKRQTPKSESKKVTFGLKNNKTAEFRKTDRSLLVSPDGSSRVAFDPEQKPKFGVLKSPSTPLTARLKKTPNRNKKASSSTPKSTPKRPSAADFF